MSLHVVQSLNADITVMTKRLLSGLVKNSQKVLSGLSTSVHLDFVNVIVNFSCSTHFFSEPSMLLYLNCDT